MAAVQSISDWGQQEATTAESEKIHLTALNLKVTGNRKVINTKDCLYILFSLSYITSVKLNH
jgi:hypothetical protein